MCAHALEILKIKKVYYCTSNSKFGGNGSVMKLNSYASEGGFFEKESIDLLKECYEEGNPKLEEEDR